MSYVCQCCGETHEGLPLNLAFAKPGAWFAKTRGRRPAWKLDADMCILGRKRFFLRGCVYVPIHDSRESFVWGVWAEVSEHVFSRYRVLFEADGTGEPPYAGSLSVELDPRFRGMDGLPVTIQFGTASERPRFDLKRSNHWLCRQQQNGVTLHQVHEMLHALFPQHF
jgi:hypothetical protein